MGSNEQTMSLQYSHDRILLPKVTVVGGDFEGNGLREQNYIHGIGYFYRRGPRAPRAQFWHLRRERKSAISTLGDSPPQTWKLLEPRSQIRSFQNCESVSLFSKPSSLSYFMTAVSLDKEAQHSCRNIWVKFKIFLNSGKCLWKSKSTQSPAYFKTFTMKILLWTLHDRASCCPSFLVVPLA